MKVLVVAAQFSSGISGVQRHALGLIKCLLHQPIVKEVHVILAPWQRQLAQHRTLHADRVLLHVATMGRGLVGRNAWYYRQLPHLVKRIRPDVVHLSYPAPINRDLIDPPVALTLHDMYPFDIPENFGFPKALFNRIMLRHCLTSVDAIACVSNATLSRLRYYLPPDIHKKALRIYNCVEPSTDCAERSPIPDWKGEPFFLSVSQHRKNKNVVLLIEAFHALIDRELIASNSQLIVVGITGPETRHILQVISSLGMPQKVHLLRGLTEQELQWCYRHCETLVAPSIIEGFGLPVAEALFAGCRVVCSDIAAFREIDSHHCRFVPLDPDGPNDLAEAIASSVAAPSPPTIALPQFSAEIIGQQYVALYRTLISATSGIRHADQLQPAISACGDEHWQNQREKLDAI
jgi:glycosyltransferase involved in cell wall biosynthesis